jgi:hypothetical protein
VRFSKEEEEDVAKCRATTKQPRTQKQVDSKGKDHQADPERRNKSTAKEKTTKAAANAEIASKGNTTKQPPNKSTSTAKEKPPSRDATVVFEKETAQQPLYVLLLDAAECLTDVVENVGNVLNAHRETNQIGSHARLAKLLV